MYTFEPIPVPNECSLSLKSPFHGPNIVDTTGHKVEEKDTLTTLCDSFKTLSSYYSSSQNYLQSLEQYTVEMAEFVKARIDHRVWEKKKAEAEGTLGSEPIIPSTIPQCPVPEKSPIYSVLWTTCPLLWKETRRLIC